MQRHAHRSVKLMAEMKNKLQELTPLEDQIAEIVSIQVEASLTNEDISSCSVCSQISAWDHFAVA